MIGSMNVARLYFGCGVYGGKIYVMGGADGKGSGSNLLKTCEVYDPMDNSWNMIADISSTPIDCQSTSVIGGKIFQIGGYISSIPITSVSVYDPLTNIWDYTYPPTPQPRYCGCATTMGGKIYYMGGHNGSSAYANMYTYDPSLVQMPQITHQGEDFYISHQRGGPKTFIIPHPEPKHKGKMLRHACVEAPTRGTNMYEIPNRSQRRQRNNENKVAVLFLSI